jgi:hypothetical protein
MHEGRKRIDSTFANEATAGFFSRLDDRELLIKRCRDNASDQRRFVIPLDDYDLACVVEWRRERDTGAISGFLKRRFQQLVAPSSGGRSMVHCTLCGHPGVHAMITMYAGSKTARVWPSAGRVQGEAEGGAIRRRRR